MNCDKVMLVGEPVMHFHRGVAFFPQGFKTVLLSTMPRSGTWYSFRLFEYLNAFFMKQNNVWPTHGFEIYHTMGFVKLHLHTMCPEFYEHYHGKYRQKWDALKVVNDAFNPDPQILRANKDKFYPALNPDIRIVYLCRNPLDQAVSYYHHGKKHKQQNMRQQVAGYANASEYLRGMGIDSFLKQYVTFRTMRKKYPNNILMYKYEDLVMRPGTFIRSFFAFCGIKIAEEKLKPALTFAVEKASIENVRKLEEKRGRSLAGDQTDPQSSHVRGGGKTGGWKNYLDDNDVKFVKNKMAEFDIDMDKEFIYEEENLDAQQYKHRKIKH